MAVHCLSDLFHTLFKAVVRVDLSFLPVSGLDHHDKKKDGNTSDGDFPENPGESQNGEIHIACAFDCYPLQYRQFQVTSGLGTAVLSDLPGKAAVAHVRRKFFSFFH